MTPSCSNKGRQCGKQLKNWCRSKYVTSEQLESSIDSTQFISSYDFFSDWNNSSYSHSPWLWRTQKERSGGNYCWQVSSTDRIWKLENQPQKRSKSPILRNIPEPLCMLWIGEVEDAKSIDDLISSASKVGDFQDCKRAQENPDEKLQETSHHCPREDSIREPMTYSEHIAWMIYDFFKISGDNEAILDFRDLSEVQLKNDNVQAFDTKWSEVSSAAIDRATDNVLEICARCKLKKSEDLKYLLQVCAQETTFGDKTHDYCRLKLMAKRHLDNKIKDSHFKARHRDDERPAIGVPGEGKAKGKGTWDALSDPAAKLTRMKVRVFSDSTLFVGVSNPDPNTIGGCMRTNTDLPNTWNLAAREVQFIWHVLPGASTLNIKKHTQTFLNGRNPHVTTPFLHRYFQRRSHYRWDTWGKEEAITISEVHSETRRILASGLLCIYDRICQWYETENQVPAPSTAEAKSKLISNQSN